MSSTAGTARLALALVTWCALGPAIWAEGEIHLPRLVSQTGVSLPQHHDADVPSSASSTTGIIEVAHQHRPHVPTGVRTHSSLSVYKPNSHKYGRLLRRNGRRWYFEGQLHNYNVC